MENRIFFSDLYFLEISEVIDSYKLLPPPPEIDSIAFLNYDKGKLLRNTPRGKQAYDDAHVSADGVPQAFSEAFGLPVTQKTTPEIYKLLQNFREDAGDLATRGAKVAYMRIRPFAFLKSIHADLMMKRLYQKTVLILRDTQQ